MAKFDWIFSKNFVLLSAILPQALLFFVWFYFLLYFPTIIRLTLSFCSVIPLLTWSAYPFCKIYEIVIYWKCNIIMTITVISHGSSHLVSNGYFVLLSKIDSTWTHNIFQIRHKTSFIAHYYKCEVIKRVKIDDYFMEK